MPEPLYLGRTVVCSALIIYDLAIIDFAIEPLDTLQWAEVIAVGLASMSIIGLIAHMFEAVRLPAEEYAYLVTGFCGLMTLLLFLGDTSDVLSRQVLHNALFLLAGVVGGYGAHIVAGGRRASGREYESRPAGLD